jgi:hypothetical protein
MFIFVPKIMFHREANKNKTKSATTAVSDFVKRSSKMTSSDPIVPQQSEVSSSTTSESEGMVILDNPAMREEMKAENQRLIRRVADLETLLAMSPISSTGDGEERANVEVTGGTSPLVDDGNTGV